MSNHEMTKIFNSPDYGVVLECNDAELADHFEDFLVENFAEGIPSKFEADAVSFFFGKTVSISTVEGLYQRFLNQNGIA